MKDDGGKVWIERLAALYGGMEYPARKVGRPELSTGRRHKDQGIGREARDVSLKLIRHMRWQAILTRSEWIMKFGEDSAAKYRSIH